MATPSSVADVHRFLGMINDLARFVPNLAEISAPLRELVVKDKDWCWDLSQEKSFDSLKELISSAKCVAKYNPKLPTVLSADASSFGIGAVWAQVQPDGPRQPVAYLSHSLTQSEQRYAQIEKEALVLTWAAERLECYLKGLDFQFETDHKPLATLLGKSPVDVLPPRVQRFRLRLMRFSFSFVSRIRKADCYCRYPLSGAPERN